MRTRLSQLYLDIQLECKIAGFVHTLQQGAER